MGRKLDEDDVIRVMHQRIVGVSEKRAKIIASHIPTAEPSASDCWSNDNRPTNDSIVTKSSRYSTDRTTDDTISRQAAIDAINGLIDRFERILADIREASADESVCGLCEYDGAYMGQSGDWCNECPGFDKDNCFKLSDSCRERWLNSVKLPSAQPEIIKCKDCKYSSPNMVYGCRLERYSYHDDSVRMYSEDFCSKAERREDERFNQQTGCN